MSGAVGNWFSQVSYGIKKPTEILIENRWQDTNVI